MPDPYLKLIYIKNFWHITNDKLSLLIAPWQIEDDSNSDSNNDDDNYVPYVPLKERKKMKVSFVDFTKV